MKVKEIVKILENFANPKLAEDWDNSGLQVGDVNTDIKKVLIALDLDDKVLDKAIDEDYQLIITHHPLIFKPLKRLIASNYIDSLIMKAVKHDISIYSAHTNLDLAKDGLNDILAELLELIDIKRLTDIHKKQLYKLAVYAPETHEEIIRETLAMSEAGHIGNYSHCTFNIKGIGTFKPNEKANAFIGEAGKLEYVNEIKIETIVEEEKLERTINNVLASHPYEEVAYDVYKLEYNNDYFGYGRIGHVKEVNARNFLDKIKTSISADKLIVYGDINRNIKTIAVCGGSGSDFIYHAYNKGAELYLTSDIKYHDSQLASQLGIIIVDGGHFNTEKIILPVIKKILDNGCNENVVIDIHDEPSVEKLFY